MHHSFLHIIYKTHILVFRQPKTSLRMAPQNTGNQNKHLYKEINNTINIDFAYSTRKDRVGELDGLRGDVSYGKLIIN
jgi:hypothetical protein